MILARCNEGRIKLAAPVTKKYGPDEINEGYSDLVGGKNLRGSEQHSGSEQHCGS
jgi:Zn-dependent alcohol dehydrogenase